MAIVKFRKGQWTLMKSKRDIVLPGGGGGGLSLSAATPSADGRTYSGSGVKPLSTITVYSGGSQVGTTTADGSGHWSFTFASQPAQGAVVGYDAVFAAPTLAVPFVPPELIKFDLNARFVAEGDSITAGSNGPTWIWAFIARTRGRFFLPYNYNQGTGGQTAAQMATQISQVTALSPKLVSLLAGTNDLAGTSDTPAQIYANLKTCWKGYIDGGAQHVIAIKVLPRTDATWTGLSTARQADRAALNTLIAGYASDPELASYKSRIHVLDLESVLVPATDMLDQLHPNWLGAIKLGNGIGDLANTLMQQAVTLNDLYADSSNLLIGAARNPLLTGITGTKSGTLAPTGDVADTWTLSDNGGITAVGSKVTLNGAAAQRILISGTSNAAGRLINFQNTAAYSGVAGDQVEACIDFALAAGHVNLRSLSLSCDTALTPSSTATLTMDGAGAISGTLRTPITAPLAGADSSTSFQAYATFGAAGAVGADITWGRPYVRKVPANI